MIITNPVIGGAYHAGRGGTPEFSRYVLRQQREPAAYLTSGRAVGDVRYVLDFGPCKVYVTPDQWREQVIREGHALIDGLWYQCERCGVVAILDCSVQGRVISACHNCPDSGTYSADGWT